MSDEQPVDDQHRDNPEELIQNDVDREDTAGKTEDHDEYADEHTENNRKNVQNDVGFRDVLNLVAEREGLKQCFG